MAFPFRSRHFQGNRALELCAVNDRDHVTQPASGDHVEKIQQALIRIAQDEPDLQAQIKISQVEINAQTYGTTTAAAVLTYKKKRGIINRSYQHRADDIVGKMTIARLDDEMFGKEGHTPSGATHADIIRNAFNASRDSLRNALRLLRSLETSVNNVAALTESEKSKALTELITNEARDILVLSRRLLTSADPLSKEFRDALHKTIDVLQQNLNQSSTGTDPLAIIVDQGSAGRCAFSPIPLASTQRKDPQPRVSVCDPFFTARDDLLRRDVITHEFFHLLGATDPGFDKDHSVSNTREALTNPNTLAQIVARLNDRTRQVNTDGNEPDIPPLPMP